MAGSSLFLVNFTYSHSVFYKKIYFGFTHTRPLKFISAPLKAKHFIGQLWQLMTASNVGFANSGMAGQVGGLQNPGVCLQVFPTFLPHPLSALLLAPFFARVLDSCSSFFAPKPHGNACYAGYHASCWKPLNRYMFHSCSHYLTMLMLRGGKSQRGVAKSYTAYKTVQLEL